MSDHIPVDLERLARCLTRSVRSPMSALPLVVIGLCLFAAACGSDAETPGEGEDPTASATTEADAETEAETEEQSSDRSIVTSDEDTGASGDTDGATTTTEGDAPTTTESATTDDGELAGESLDFAPRAGTPLAIVGLAFDDSLNFRAEPSPDADVLASFGPLSGDLDTSALGEAWAAPSGVWWKVNVAGTEAWANQAFLGSLGSTVNAYDQLAAELDGFEYETIEAAALAVAALRSSDDPESRIVFASEPLAFETGGVLVVDVLDLGDDSVKGERIRVEVQTVFDEASGEEGAQDVDHFLIVDIELTPICGRGLTDGLCT